MHCITKVKSTHIDNYFRNSFLTFNDDGNKVYEIEQAGSFQKYPELYYAKGNILNQYSVFA